MMELIIIVGIVVLILIAGYFFYSTRRPSTGETIDDPADSVPMPRQSGAPPPGQVDPQTPEDEMPAGKATDEPASSQERQADDPNRTS